MSGVTVILDADNSADASFPTAGLEVIGADGEVLAFTMILDDVTSVAFEGINSPQEANAEWVDCTPGVVAESLDGGAGHAKTDFTAPAAVPTRFSVVWRCHFERYRITVDFANATNSAYIDVRKRGI